MYHLPNFKCCSDPGLMIKLGQVTTVDKHDLLNTFQELWKDVMKLESDNELELESWIIPASVQVVYFYHWRFFKEARKYFECIKRDRLKGLNITRV